MKCFSNYIIQNRFDLRKYGKTLQCTLYFIFVVGSFMISMVLLLVFHLDIDECSLFLAAVTLSGMNLTDYSEV